MRTPGMASFHSPGSHSGVVEDLPQLRSTIAALKDDNRELTQCLEALMKERKAELVLHKECDAEMMMLLGGLESSMGQLEKDYRQARYDADHAEKKRQEDIEKLMREMDVESAMKGSEKAKLMDEILILRRSAEEEKKRSGTISKEKSRLEADIAVLKAESSMKDSEKAKLMDEILALRSAVEEEKQRAAEVFRENISFESELAELTADQDATPQKTAGRLERRQADDESSMKGNETAKLLDEIRILRKAAEEEKQRAEEVFREKTRLESELAEIAADQEFMSQQNATRILRKDSQGESELIQEIQILRRAAEEEKQRAAEVFREKTRLESELAELTADQDATPQKTAGRLERRQADDESSMKGNETAKLLDEIRILRKAAEEEKQRADEIFREKTRLESELAEIAADQEFMSQQNATRILRKDSQGESELIQEIQILRRAAEEEKQRAEEVFREKTRLESELAELTAQGKSELIQEIQILRRAAEEEKQRAAEVFREKTRLESELAELTADQDATPQKTAGRLERRQADDESSMKGNETAKLLDEIRILRKAAEEEKQRSEEVFREKTRLESELAEIAADQEFMSQQNATRILRKDSQGESELIQEIQILRRAAEEEKQRAAEVFREKTRLESELAELTADQDATPQKMAGRLERRQADDESSMKGNETAKLLDEIRILRKAAEEEKQRADEIFREKTRLESELAEIAADQEFMSQQNATRILRKDSQGESELIQEIQILRRAAEEEKQRAAEVFREKTRLESELAELTADQDATPQKMAGRLERRQADDESSMKGNETAKLLDEIRILRKAAEEEKQRSEEVFREKTRLESELAEIAADQEFMSQQNATRILRKDSQGESQLIDEIRILRRAAEEEKQRTEEVFREKTRLESELAELTADQDATPQKTAGRLERRQADDESSMKGNETAKLLDEIRILRKAAEEEKQRSEEVFREKTRLESELAEIAADKQSMSEQNTIMRKEREEVGKRALHIRRLREEQTKEPLVRPDDSLIKTETERFLDDVAELSTEGGDPSSSPTTTNDHATGTEQDKPRFHLFDSEAALPPTRSRLTSSGQRTSAHRHHHQPAPASRIGGVGGRACVPSAKVELAALDELFDMKSKLMTVQSKVI